MAWKKYKDERPNAGDVCLCRFRCESYRITRYVRPFDRDTKYNPEFYVWSSVDNFLSPGNDLIDFSVEDHDEWIKIDTERKIEY